MSKHSDAFSEFLRIQGRTPTAAELSQVLLGKALDQNEKILSVLLNIRDLVSEICHNTYKEVEHNEENDV